MKDVDREINNTRNWGLTIIAAFLLPTIGIFIWVGGIENRVANTEQDVQEIKTELNALKTDIRSILVGIEQIKGRLGIIEDNE